MARHKRVVKSSAAPSRDARMRALADSVGSIGDVKGWLPARQVLLEVEAVPTIFPQFDHYVRVGGLPIKRYTLLHGESAKGKTKAMLGFELSFLRQGHFVFHVDAEMATPITWCAELMAQHADNLGFRALRPSCFEEVDDATRRAMTTIGEARAKGRIPMSTSGLVCVDSIQKLVPKKGFERLLKEGAEKAGADGASGRMGQMRAALLKQWLDEVIPLAHDTNCALVMISRESEDPNASEMDRRFGRNYRIGGGKAVIYDSSLTIRVEQAWVTQGADEDKDVIGERHRMRIHRTKVAGKDDREVHAYFHTSNGKLVPEGFDLARDVVTLGIDLGLFGNDGKSAWLHWGKHRWQGVNQAVKRLSQQPELLSELEAEVRALRVQKAEGA